jgi:hypothetical protein
VRRAAVREWLRSTARPVATRATAAVLLLAGLAAVLWLGGRWADAGRPGSAGRVSASPAAATVAPTGTSRTEAAVSADRQETPASPAEWRLVLEELYARRAQSFAAGAPELLAGVYAPSSAQRAADEAHLEAMAAAGESLRGFAPAVVEVTGVIADGHRARLDLIDSWADYEVAGAGPGSAVRAVPGRPATAVRMVLLRTGDGWRIESAERLG